MYPTEKITFPSPFRWPPGTFSTCTDGRIQHDGIHRIYGHGISQKDHRLTPKAPLFTGCDGCTKSCEANRELLVETPNSHGKPDGKKGHDFFLAQLSEIKGTIFLGQNTSKKDGAKMLKLHTVPLIWLDYDLNHQTFQVPSKWRNPHLYKPYLFGLCKGKPLPQNSRIFRFFLGTSILGT